MDKLVMGRAEGIWLHFLPTKELGYTLENENEIWNRDYKEFDPEISFQNLHKQRRYKFS